MNDSVAVRAGRLVDVQAGEILEDRMIVVEGDRIDAVMPVADLPNSFGGEQIDLSGHTVAPGLIDCHAHLVGPIESESGLFELELSDEQMFEYSVANAKATIEAGFTTVRDVGTFRAFSDLALGAEIDAGRVLGPRMSCAGAYVTCPGGGGTLSAIPDGVEVPERFRLGVVENEDDVRRVVNRFFDEGVDFIKLIATGAVLIVGTDAGADELTEGQIRAAVEVAQERGSYATAHAHAASGIKNAIRGGCRSIEHGSLMDDEAIAMMAEHGTVLVADIYCGDWIAEEGARGDWPEETLRKNEETTDAQREGFGKAVKAGVTIAFGTDSGVYPHGWNGKQLPYMVRYGMTPIEGLRAATQTAAELMGWEADVGAVAPGRYADLVAIDGHDIGDLSAFEQVDWVMKGGTVAKSG